MSDVGIAGLGRAQSLTSFGKACRRMPGGMWVAVADACDRAMRGFWPVFRAEMGIKRTGYRFTLTSVAAWPIQITGDPIPSYQNPDFRQFRARFGTKSEAAAGLEFGGDIIPQRSRWVAIPLAGARSRTTGRLLPGHQSPDSARRGLKRDGRVMRKGKAFLAESTKNPNVILLFPWVKAKKFKLQGPKAKRGQVETRKRKRSGRIVPGPVPAFMLVRSAHQEGGKLGLDRAWKRNQPETDRRLSENIGRAIADVLAGRTPRTRLRPR